MKAFFKKIFKSFLRGFLALLPLIATVYVVTGIFRFVERTAIDWIVMLIPAYNRELPGVVMVAEIATAVGMFFLVVGLGILVRTLFGKQLVGLVERIINGIPGVNSVYKTIRQAIDLFSLRKTMGTLQPVLVQYPNQGVWAVAFHTGPWEERHSPKSDRKFVTVFMPTTPNPTTGILLVMPTESVKPLNVPIDNVLKMVLTGGMVKK